MEAILDKDDQILRGVAEAVPGDQFSSSTIKKLVAKLFAIMEEKGAVGVAAPQIGVNKRVIVFGTSYTKRRTPEIEIPNTVLINPEINFLTEDEEVGYEGCLNLGEIMGPVPRITRLEYSGYDTNGNFIKKEASGLEARILQHEVDHLNGILFPDRIVDKSTLTTYAELAKRHTDET